MNPPHVCIMKKKLNENIRKVRVIAEFPDSIVIKDILLDHT